MKNKILLMLGLSLTCSAFSQNNWGSNFNAGMPGRPNSQVAPTYLSNLISRPLRIVDIPNLSGSPYLTPDYKIGYVKIKNGYSESNVPMRFNVYFNLLEFKKGAIEMELDSLDIAVFLEKEGDSSTIRVLKTGYPNIDNQTDKTIYEVLAMGNKAHLLKYRKQKIEDVKSMGEYGQKEMVTISYSYVYLPGKGIFKLKPNTDDIIELFPTEAAKIKQTIKTRKLNLKKDTDLAELITELNKAETI